MSITLYDASVPVFRRYLVQLSSLVDRAMAHAAEHGLEPHALLEARLAPTMFPFATQVEIAVNFVPRTCAPLAGFEVPPYGEYERSFAGLKQRIAKAHAFLDTLAPAQMEGAAERTITSRAGMETVTLPGREFLTLYALPNFFFHLSAAYAILRHAGVELGKRDFDGFHLYPAPSN
ncbi:MAG TPA: DUF1993 domain-containing protein [Paucimonas sp.]|nr:DUF1993 domain-containing protein [Paucimonas sp.]